MFRAFCDGPNCLRPVEPTDNHVEIQGMGLVDKGQVFRASNLHFCGKGCLNGWIDKAIHGPMIIPARTVNGN